MADMCKCCNCGAIFPVEDATRIEECVGEFWGAPAYESWDACPVCKDTDIEDYEPMEYWVSYTLQDGTQTGATLTINGAYPESVYDELVEELKKMHGEDFGDIADYGSYEELEEQETETGNMPCDNYGMCAGSSCTNYPKCQGWVK